MNSVAVCISGQIRNDDLALEQISDALAHIQADIYISVWSKRGAKTFSGDNGVHQLNRIFGQEMTGAIPLNWARKMREVFPDSSQIFPSMGEIADADLRKFFPNAIIDIEEEVIDYTFNHSDSNSYRMLYKIWRCNGMKKKAEIKRGAKYERVIRMRPDLCLDFSRLDAIEIGANDLIAPPHNPHFKRYLNDLYWMGTSETDNKIANVFSLALNSQNDTWHGIHLELYNWSQQEDINIVCEHSVITAGVSGLAARDAENIAAVQRNFVKAVKERHLDVKYAGGEAFCQIASTILSASLAQIEGRTVELDTSQLIQRINEICCSDPSLSNVAIFLGSYHFLSQKKYSLSTRLAFFKFIMTFGLTFKAEQALHVILGGLPKMFPGKQRIFLELLANDILPEATDISEEIEIPDEWTNRLLGEDGQELEFYIKPSDFLLSNNWLCNWVGLRGGPTISTEVVAEIRTSC